MAGLRHTRPVLVRGYESMVMVSKWAVAAGWRSFWGVCQEQWCVVLGCQQLGRGLKAVQVASCVLDNS